MSNDTNFKDVDVLKEKGGKKYNYKQVEHLALFQAKKSPGFEGKRFTTSENFETDTILSG